MLLAAAVLARYFILDVPLALGMLVVFGVLIWIGEPIAARAPAQGWIWFAVLFVGGSILQRVGHVLEGRKPALADNLFQIFVAPIFLAAEVAFVLGYKPELRPTRQFMRAQSAVSSIILTRTSSRSGASGSRSR